MRKIIAGGKLVWDAELAKGYKSRSKNSLERRTFLLQDITPLIFSSFQQGVNIVKMVRKMRKSNKRSGKTWSKENHLSPFLCDAMCFFLIIVIHKTLPVVFMFIFIKYVLKGINSWWINPLLVIYFFKIFLFPVMMILKAEKNGLFIPMLLSIIKPLVYH